MADYVVPQDWEAFTAEDHAVWDLLFARQVDLLGSRVVSPFLDGIDLLRLSHPGVPDVEGLNAILEPRTGWRTVAVPGLVPDDVFFAMLSERVFPVGNFIRTRDAARLSRSARLLPRHVRPYPDARASRLCRDDAAHRRARLGGHRRRPGAQGGAALLAQRRVRAGEGRMAS